MISNRNTGDRASGSRFAAATSVFRSRHTAAVAAVAVGAWLFTAPAAAKDRVIDFEDQPAEGPDATLSTQHQEGDGTGLVWQEPPPERWKEVADRARVAEVPAGEASSGTKVAQGEYHPGQEFSTGSNAIWARFDAVRDEVRLNVGWKSAEDAGRIMLVQGFDASGDLLDQDNKFVPPTGAMQAAELNAPGIRWVKIAELHGQQVPLGRVRIDDFTFDDLKGESGTEPPKLPPPDFMLNIPPSGFGTPSLVAGGTRDIPIEVDRFNGAAGPLAFSASGLPPGVQAQWLPAQTNDANEVTLRLSATPGVASTSNANITVTATPTSAQAGNAPRSAQFVLDVFASFDLTLRGVEVTQGIQEEFIACNSAPECASNVSLRPNAPGGTVEYKGVPLIQDKPTYARVFAGNNASQPVENATVKLFGYDRKGKALPGSPLVQTGVSAPPVASEIVSTLERVGTAQATFELPLSWTEFNLFDSSGGLSLRAEITGPNEDLINPTATECKPGCDANNSYRLDEIGFVDIEPISVAMVQMLHDGAPPHLAPERVMELPQLLLPLGLWDLEEDDAYRGTIFIDDLNRLTQAGLLERPDSPARNRLEDFADDHVCTELSGHAATFAEVAGQAGFDFYPEGCADMVVGIYHSSFFGAGSSTGTLATSQRPTIVAAFGTPLNTNSRYVTQSTLTHELAHGMGRVHADKACGGNSDGQEGEDWPPDNAGRMDGIGYDPNDFGVHKDSRFGLPTEATEYFDFMSYCWGDGTYSGSNPARWVSVTGWVKTIAELVFRGHLGRKGASRVGAAAETGRHPEANHRGTAPTLRVRGSIAPDGTGQILSTERLPGPVGSPPPESDFSFVVRGADGAELARMIATSAEVSEGGFEVFADVPAAGAERVELVTTSGAVLDSRARSAAAPGVTLDSPRNGEVGRKRSVSIRWATTDPDSPSRSATIEYSTNNGRTWDSVWSGPDSGRAVVPSEALAASKKGRIRVRVNDGFSEGSATSARLRVAGTPPRVTIHMPVTGTPLTAEDRVVLAGAASDDRRREIKPKRLSWYDGKRKLGRGESVELEGLPAGNRRIRLMARDAKGRESSASVRVRIQAVAPVAAPLELPELLSPKARKMKIRIATNVDATLSVRGKGVRSKGKSYKVGRKQKTVAVKVKRGNATLRPKVILKAGGKRSRTVAEVSRG